MSHINDLRRTAKKQRQGDGATGAPQLRHGDKVRTTRGNLRQFPNATYGYQHVHMDKKYFKDERAFNAYKAKKKQHDKDMAAYNKAHGKTGGRRRRRGSRYTRRR
jgi:hypothetical protein